MAGLGSFIAGSIDPGTSPGGFGTGGAGPMAVAAITSAAVSPKLTASPTTAVQNESVVLIGTNYSSKSVAGGTGAGGRHQINSITMSGTALQAPYITYPIDLDDGGTWFAEVIIPGNASTLAANSLSFAATDTGGASASATVSLRSRSTSLDKASSRIGSTIKIDGSGFPATNTTSSDSYRVNLKYGTTSLTSVTPDSSGKFETTFKVPISALIPSTNTVTATVVGTIATASAEHSVPGATISVSPTESPSGITFTVTGTNFHTFRAISEMTIGVPSVLPSSSITTDKDGSFTVSGLVPQLPPGTKIVAVTIGSVRAFTSFKVTEPDVPLTPTPAPTPIQTPTATSAPPSAPSLGLAPLVEGDNLVRVWHFDPATQSEPPDFGWSLFDPRPVFAPANTVAELVSGRFYWIGLKQSQTATLNGKQRVLFAGWNPVTW
jgi:hypothetical protein